MRQDTNVSEDFVASIFWVKESSVFNERLNTKILVVMVLMWLSEL
jgi:predicted thioredoxin/glutaredoxin